MFTLNFKVDDDAFKDLKSSLKKENLTLQVGIIDAGTHEGTEQTVASIGALHEFGSAAQGIPERSFIRETVFSKQREINAVMAKQASKAIENNQPLNKSLGIIGEFTKGLIQESFTNNDWSPLSESTIAAKGSSRPLIDTGQLRQSITWSVSNA